MLLGAVCIVALGTALYIKVKPGSSLVSPSANLTIISPTSTAANIERLRNKVAYTNNATNDELYTQNTLTDSISQEFAQNYLKYQQNGDLTVEDEADLLNTMASTYATDSSITLSLSDISTFPDENKAKVKEFGNRTAQAVLSYYNILKTSPIDIISESQAKNATTTLEAKLIPIAKSYHSLALDLQKIPAPQSFAPYYVDSINGYIALGDDVEKMSGYFSDPVKSFLGLNKYQNDLVAQIDLLKNFPIYFKSNDILFNESEEGKVWTSLQF